MLDSFETWVLSAIVVVATLSIVTVVILFIRNRTKCNAPYPIVTTDSDREDRTVAAGVCPDCHNELTEVTIDHGGWCFAYGELWFVAAVMAIFSVATAPQTYIVCEQCEVTWEEG